MIIYNGKELAARYVGKKAVTAVYYGARLVWEAISSCFGAGMWSNEKPWKNEDGWKD